MSETYTRRPVPPTYQSAWLDTELQKIQRVLAGAKATAVTLTADVSNSVAATDKATGLKASVLSGTSYLLRWTVVIASNTNTGGAILKVTHPTYTTGFIHARGNSSAATTFGENEPTVGASPTTVNALAAPYVAYNGTGIVVIEHRLTPSANGTVELTIAPNTNTQNYTMKAGSTLEVFTA